MTKRDRTIVAIAACVAVVVGAWMFFIQPKRSEASKLGDQITQQRAALDAARAQVLAGAAARSRFPSDYTSLAQLGKAVPADDDVASLIYEVQHAASSTSVDFRSLQLQPGSGSTPASPSGGASSQASGSSLPPGATIGPAGFPILPFTFTFDGNFFHLNDFFYRLHRFVVATGNQVAVSGRLMTINAINLGAGPQGFPQIKATISATAFVVPPTQGLFAGMTPGGPTSTPSAGGASPSSGSVATPTAAIAIR